MRVWFGVGMRTRVWVGVRGAARSDCAVPWTGGVRVVRVPVYENANETEDEKNHRIMDGQ